MAGFTILTCDDTVVPVPTKFAADTLPKFVIVAPVKSISESVPAINFCPFKLILLLKINVESLITLVFLKKIMLSMFFLEQNIQQTH